MHHIERRSLRCLVKRRFWERRIFPHKIPRLDAACGLTLRCAKGDNRRCNMRQPGERYVSLDQLIYEAKYNPDFKPLTGEQKDRMIEIFGHRCRAKTKDALYRRLCSLSTMKSYGIFTRVAFWPDGTVEYIPGQDYNAEIRTVRECILE